MAELSPRAATFKQWATDEWELDAPETAVLEDVANTMSHIDNLEDTIARDGVTTLGSTGQVVAHPALLEVRQQRALLARLLGMLDLGDDDAETLRETSTKARAAANARWQKHRRADGRY